MWKRKREKGDGMGVRVFSVELPLSRDGGKDSYEITTSLLKAAQLKLGFRPGSEELKTSQVQIVRKSFDGRVRGRVGSDKVSPSLSISHEAKKLV